MVIDACCIRIFMVASCWCVDLLLCCQVHLSIFKGSGSFELISILMLKNIHAPHFFFSNLDSCPYVVAALYMWCVHVSLFTIFI
jgi:hypothetical protein